MKTLTKRRIDFCKHYVLLGNATEAAIKAGYSTKNARFTASHLLSYNNIKQQVSELDKARLKQLGIATKEDYILATQKNWENTRSESAKARYWEMLGNVLQYIKPAHNVNVNYDTLKIDYRTAAPTTELASQHSANSIAHLPDDKSKTIPSDDNMGDKSGLISDKAAGVAHPLEGKDIDMASPTPTSILTSVRNADKQKSDISSDKLMEIKIGTQEIIDVPSENIAPANEEKLDILAADKNLSDQGKSPKCP